MEHQEEEPGKTFTCSQCELSTKYTEFGNKPPGSKGLILLENAYMLKDPFTVEHNTLIVGGQCIICDAAVCMDEKCSIYYTKRFCIGCLKKNIGKFPDEIQQKVERT